MRDSVIKITTMYLPTMEMEKELPVIPNIRSENDDSEVGTNTFIITLNTYTPSNNKFWLCWYEY